MCLYFYYINWNTWQCLNMTLASASYPGVSLPLPSATGYVNQYDLCCIFNVTCFRPQLHYTGLPQPNPIRKYWQLHCSAPLIPRLGTRNTLYFAIFFLPSNSQYLYEKGRNSFALNLQLYTRASSSCSWTWTLPCCSNLAPQCRSASDYPVYTR